MKAAAILLFLLTTPLIAGSLDAQFGAAVTGVVGNPAINACANNIDHTDGSLISVLSCLVFSATNPFNSGPESYTIGGLASTDSTGIHALASATVSNVDLQSGSLQMSPMEGSSISWGSPIQTSRISPWSSISTARRLPVV